LVWFLLKKIIKLNLKTKTNKKIKTGSNQPVSVRFGYFRAKTKTQPIASVFSGLARLLILVRFSFSVSGL
jgi:hypothetical protein